MIKVKIDEGEIGIENEKYIKRSIKKEEGRREVGRKEEGRKEEGKKDK